MLTRLQPPPRSKTKISTLPRHPTKCRDQPNSVHLLNSVPFYTRPWPRSMLAKPHAQTPKHQTSQVHLLKILTMPCRQTNSTQQASLTTYQHSANHVVPHASRNLKPHRYTNKQTNKQITQTHTGCQARCDQGVVELFRLGPQFLMRQSSRTTKTPMP